MQGSSRDSDNAAAEIKALEEERRRINRQSESCSGKAKGIASLIQETERSLERHSSSGSLSPGGTVSLSHVKTTRRLNEELEGLIRSIDDNRRVMKELSVEAIGVNEKLLETERRSRHAESERKKGAEKKLRLVGAVVARVVELTKSKNTDY